MNLIISNPGFFCRVFILNKNKIISDMFFFTKSLLSNLLRNSLYYGQSMFASKSIQCTSAALFFTNDVTKSCPQIMVVVIRFDILKSEQIRCSMKFDK